MSFNLITEEFLWDKYFLKYGLKHRRRCKYIKFCTTALVSGRRDRLDKTRRTDMLLLYFNMSVVRRILPRCDLQLSDPEFYS